MAVHEKVDHAIDHAEVIVTVELLFQVDQVAVHPVEPPREKTAKVQADRRVLLEHGHGILDNPEPAWLDGPDFGGVRYAKKGGEISEDGPRLIGAGHRDSPLGDFDDALDEEIDQSCGGPFGDHRLTRVEAAEGLMLEKIEQRTHVGGRRVDKPLKRRAVSMPVVVVIAAPRHREMKKAFRRTAETLFERAFR